MTSISRPAVLALCMISVSCSAPRTADGAPIASGSGEVAGLPREGLAMSEFAVSMRRGACFGRCPQYTVTIDGGGGIEFVGERFVGVVGTRHGTIGMQAVAELRRRTNVVFASFGDVVPGAASCPHYVTDQPQITLTLRNAEGVQTLRHYSGCAPASAELSGLEALIDRTANVDAWVAGDATR